MELPNAIMGKDGVLKTSKEEMKEEFHKFYTDLFTQSEISDTLSREIVESRMNCLERIAKTNPKDFEESITEKEIETQINKLKNKMTMDKQGISNVIIKNAGKDFKKSIKCIFNEIKNEKEQPDQWKEMIVNSIYKKKGDMKDLENRRGLFITNNVSKLYDKVKMERNKEKLNRGISKHQCGGMTGKSTVDHTMTLNAVIDYNRYIGSETFIVFADAYKCFDKLNLKDCICDISEIIGAEDAFELYNMNKVGKATIKTPIGLVENVEANNIVRQGTIPGPKLCNVNTDKINTIGRKCYTYIGPRVRIETLTYVDDIQNGSSNTNEVKKVVRNLCLFESCKGYTFSTEKKKSAIMIVGKKKKKEYNIEVSVKNGKIPMANEYKYVGRWYDEKGDNSLAIKKKKENVGLFVQKIKEYGNEHKIGKYAMKARIRIYQGVVVPTMYHLVETWSNITKSDWEELESMQKRVVTGMCEMRRSTPYIGLLTELGIWPAEQLIEYKQVRLLHNILTSRDDRLLKEIVEDQIAYPWEGNWYEGVKTTCQKYDLEIDEIRTWSKNKCKRIMKKKVKEVIQKKVDTAKKEMTKMRFIKSCEIESYIDKVNYDDCVTLLKTRLNMIETKCNYKGKFLNDLKCPLCKLELDTTEHLTECQGLMEEKSVSNISNPNDKLAKSIKKAIKIREDNGFKITFGDE